MKKLNLLTSLIPIILFWVIGIQAAFAQCPEGMVIGIGAGEDKETADRKADIDIARQINSSIDIEEMDILIQVMTDGAPEDKNDFMQNVTAKSGVSNRHFVKQSKPHYKNESGETVSERYICRMDAAKPYLLSLDSLARELKEQTKKASSSCDAINKIRYNIAKMESVLDNLRADYKELQKQYKSDGKAGIYLDVEEEIFGKKSDVMHSKLKEALSGDNCHVKQNACEADGSFTLKVKASADIHKNDGNFYHCKSKLKVTLFNDKNENVISPSVETIISWRNKEEACEKAFEDAAHEIWEKIKTKTVEVCK